MNDLVGILVVSHSPDVARGAAALASEMTGSSVHVEFCGGNRDGGSGTDVTSIRDCLDRLLTARDVAVVYDFGGARMNTEMALTLLDSHQQERVVLCDAPIVEGAVLAATEASLGSNLQMVRAAAEDA